MLLMCHLFVGLLIGLVAFILLKDRRVVLLAAIGSLLPDLIDKPLGHIILNGSIDFGRIYAHSGLFFVAVLIVCIAYRQRKGSWILIALVAGLLSHLALDSMWEMPVTIFYPFLGDFGTHHFPNYIESSLAHELGSAYEWMFGVSALAMLLFSYRDRLGRLAETISWLSPRIVKSASMLLVLTGFVAIAYGMASAYNPLSRETSAEQNLIIGLAAVIGGLIMYHLWIRDKVDPAKGLSLNQ